MVNIIASRVAGIKLGWVVAVLLLPFAYLTWYMNNGLAKDTEFVSRELLGLKLVRLITPVFTSGERDSAYQGNLVRMAAEGTPIAEKLDLGQAFDDFYKVQLDKSSTRESHLFSGNELLKKLGTNSNLILDPEAESYMLASTITVGVADATADYSKLQSSQMAKASTFKLFTAAGHLEKTIDHNADSIRMAIAAAGDAKGYADIQNSINMMQSIYSYEARNLELGQAFATDRPEFYAATAKLSESVSDRLEPILQARSQKLKMQRLVNFIVAAASILTGLGSAIWMFRSTLRRLDELSISKSAAENARRQAEVMNSQLALMNENTIKLNKDLAENMRHLKGAQDELLKKGRMEQLGQLIATVAHELRNPLGSVRTSAYLVERKLKGTNSGLDTQMGRISKGIARCDSIITQLLDYSRNKKIDAKSENLDAWLAELLTEQSKQLPENVAITCELGLNEATIPFDRSRLARGIVNLVNNASEAMVGKPEAPIKDATASPMITVKTALKDDMVAISVSDNGPGMAPEVLAKVREPLFTTKSFGTGLGIPAVEQIAIQHGGRLEIESTVGQGSSFIILLPLQEVGAQAA